MKKLLTGLMLVGVLLGISGGGTAIAAPQSFAISFTDNADNESGFRLERCMGTSCTTFAVIATLAVNTTSHTDGNLPENTTFCYRVKAFNAVGESAYSNTACATTPVTLPNAPSVLMIK